MGAAAERNVSAGGIKPRAGEVLLTSGKVQGWIAASSPKQVAQLHEESVRYPLQTVELERVGLGKRAAISGEDHRPGVRLVGKEPVHTQSVVHLPGSRCIVARG